MFHSSILSCWIFGSAGAIRLPKVVVASGEIGPKYLPCNRNGGLSTAAPVFDRHGRIVAVLSLYASADRLAHMVSLVDELLQVAGEASEAWAAISAFDHLDHATESVLGLESSIDSSYHCLRSFTIQTPNWRGICYLVDRIGHRIGCTCSDLPHLHDVAPYFNGELCQEIPAYRTARHPGSSLSCTCAFEDVACVSSVVLECANQVSMPRSGARDLATSFTRLVCIGLR